MTVKISEKDKESLVKMIAEAIENSKPYWEEFVVVELGYNKEQAKLFAEGYAEKLLTLPLKEQIVAIEIRHDPCMTAGFEAAGIDEKEAIERYKAFWEKRA